MLWGEPGRGARAGSAGSGADPFWNSSLEAPDAERPHDVPGRKSRFQNGTRGYYHVRDARNPLATGPAQESSACCGVNLAGGKRGEQRRDRGQAISNRRSKGGQGAGVACQGFPEMGRAGYLRADAERSCIEVRAAKASSACCGVNRAGGESRGQERGRLPDPAHTIPKLPSAFHPLPLFSFSSPEWGMHSAKMEWTGNGFRLY